MKIGRWLNNKGPGEVRQQQQRKTSTPHRQGNLELERALVSDFEMVS